MKNQPITLSPALMPHLEPLYAEAFAQGWTKPVVLSMFLAVPLSQAIARDFPDDLIADTQGMVGTVLLSFPHACAVLQKHGGTPGYGAAMMLGKSTAVVDRWLIVIHEDIRAFGFLDGKEVTQYEFQLQPRPIEEMFSGGPVESLTIHFADGAPPPEPEPTRPTRHERPKPKHERPRPRRPGTKRKRQ